MAREWRKLPEPTFRNIVQMDVVELGKVEALRAIAEELQALREMLAAGPSLEEMLDAGRADQMP